GAASPRAKRPPPRPRVSGSPPLRRAGGATAGALGGAGAPPAGPPPPLGAVIAQSALNYDFPRNSRTVTSAPAPAPRQTMHTSRGCQSSLVFQSMAGMVARPSPQGADMRPVLAFIVFLASAGAALAADKENTLYIDLK